MEHTGGPVRFGYHLTDSGLVNRKGAKIKKYEIDEAESEVLRMIDDMTVHKGYGSYRMADFLNKNGYAPSGGGKFTSIKVIRILRDPFYCGRLADGTTSPQLEALRLRSDDTYDRILYILEQRQNRNEEKRHIALQTKGQAMLSGNIFCAHCGGRLTTIRYRDSYTRADGTEYSVDQIKYSCYHKSRKLCQCDGQTTYQADRVDESIKQIIRKIFGCMDGAPEEEKLQLEIGKTLTGESSYAAEDLSQAIQTVKVRIAEAEKKLEELRAEEEKKRQGIDLIIPEYERFKSWAEEFDMATLEQQKMIACHLFRRIEVGRDYQIRAELNMTYRQFCSEWGGGDLLRETVV